MNFNHTPPSARLASTVLLDKFASKGMEFGSTFLLITKGNTQRHHEKRSKVSKAGNIRAKDTPKKGQSKDETWTKGEDETVRN
jgi:hypothetical protein